VAQLIVLMVRCRIRATWKILAGRAVLLRDGRIVQEGPVQELARSPADEFVAHFVRAQERPS